MTIRDLQGFVEDRVPVKTVLVSVFDKGGLEQFILELFQINSDVQILSTGGTYDRIKVFLGESQRNNLMEISQYTQFPEMEGGLVKTLHPKIHAGILGERNNTMHQKYLSETLSGAAYIDMVVVNLYPFSDVVNAPETNFEKARGNIDIGGPALIRAAAKNFPSCAAVCDPADYQTVLKDIAQNKGASSFEQRLRLAQKAFDVVSRYDQAIAAYFGQQVDAKAQEIKSLYQFNQGAKNG